MVALDLALELEAILLDAVRTHVEGGEVDVSSVSLRPQELARLVPRGVDASLFVQAGLLVKSGSMYKLAPHVMLALRDPDKAGSREQLAVAAAAAASSESPASEAAGTKRPAAADGGGEGGGTPMRKRAHSNLTLPLVHGLPAGVPLIWSWSVEQVCAASPSAMPQPGAQLAAKRARLPGDGVSARACHRALRARASLAQGTLRRPFHGGHRPHGPDLLRYEGVSPPRYFSPAGGAPCADIARNLLLHPQAEVDGQLRLCIGGHFHRRQGFEAGEYGVTSVGAYL
jgi:hypothetical protein